MVKYKMMKYKMVRHKMVKHNKKRKKVKGSATIEAAIVIPLIFIILIMLIQLTFFLYNRVSVTESAYICALRGSQMEHHNANQIYSQLKKITGEVLESRTLALPFYEEKIEVKGDKVCVTLKIEQNGWKFETTKEAKQQNPVFFIRNYRKLQNLQKE